jgi:hypothetical protein
MRYFEIRTMGEDEWPFFNGHPTPSGRTPGFFDVLDEFQMSASDYVSRANSLFDEYGIKVPPDYPRLKEVKRKFFRTTFESNPMTDFAICVGSCILMKEEFGTDVSRIVRKELIESSSRSAILHANSMASVALFYLRHGSSVVIPPEMKEQSNPDLVIDGWNCEIKTVDESDWTRDIDPSTGRGKARFLSEDICYDVGQFISKRDSGHKGIKQSDVVFADLSLKSIGWIEKITGVKKDGFPKLKKCRIIYFTKKITQFSSFYLDFDPQLWDLIKTTDARHSFSVIGKSAGAT